MSKIKVESKRYRITGIIALLFCISWFTACTQQPNKELETIHKSQHVIDSLMTAQNIPGLQVAVWKAGKLVFSEGFGFADLEQNVPVNTATKLRIGSVSKTITSVALARLYEESKLLLDTLVQAYVPYFPEKKWPITVRQIAGHTAGIRHYRGNEFRMNKHFNSVKESLSIFADDTLLFEPGTDYSYSSYGWNLVSGVVEGASQMPFLSYMNQEILTPLGMNETVAEYNDSLITNRTRYYTYSAAEDGTVVNAPTVDNSYKWAGGGFIGTAEDLITFGEQIIWGDFLQPETVEMLTTSQELASGKKTGYGIGWRVDTDKKDRPYYGHSGGSVGGTTQFVVFPDQEVIVAMIANIGGVSYRGIHLDIADYFMNGDS